jgi:hypothetical protein
MSGCRPRLPTRPYHAKPSGSDAHPGTGSPRRCWPAWTWARRHGRPVCRRQAERALLRGRPLPGLLVDGLPLEADYVLSRNFDSLLDLSVAPALGVVLELFDRLDQRQRQLGHRHGRSSLTWVVTRLLLWRGDLGITAITCEDITAFGEEVHRWCALPEAPLIRAAYVHKASPERNTVIIGQRMLRGPQDVLADASQCTAINSQTPLGGQNALA